MHYTLFLLPVMLHHWTRPMTWAAAALLMIPVSTVLGQFGAPPINQLTYGSVYGWAVVICMAVVLLDGQEERVPRSRTA